MDEPSDPWTAPQMSTVPEDRSAGGAEWPPAWIPTDPDSSGPPLPLELRLRTALHLISFKESQLPLAERLAIAGMHLDTRTADLRQGGPDGRASSYEVCCLCARQVVPAGHRWTWLACRTCLEVDSAAAERIGARRVLPLGRHSIMNGIGAPVTSEGVSRAAILDQLSAVQCGWSDLRDWLGVIVRRLAGEAGVDGCVRWADWQAMYPPSAEASITGHAAYLSQRQPAVARLLAPEGGDGCR